MSEDRVHHAEVKAATGLHDPYQAVCDVCGEVGVPQRYYRDAWAIADRHEEIGGFERWTP
jgi:hypothetical protein